MTSLAEKHGSVIEGPLSCFDRVVIMGTLPDICHAGALAAYLGRHKIRLFDFTQWAEPLRAEIRANAERLALEHGVEIEFVRRSGEVRKADLIGRRLAERSTQPGLVHIVAAIERCPSFRPWYDKKTGRTLLKPTDGKCLHYYFYFIDAELGLCYLRVPTWAPFRLQFYFNGHAALARSLSAEGLAFTLADNCFTRIADPAAAQRLADHFEARHLHAILDRYAAQFCPALTGFPAGYHWSLMQIEYATDLIFTRAEDLQPIYTDLVHTAVHAVQAGDVATFLGRKLSATYQGEIGGDFHTRIAGTRIKHHMGPASIKMYDKRGCVLRIETTVSDVSFFKHYRQVEHRDGSTEMKIAPVTKTIYSLGVLRTLLGAANRRYLAFLATLDDHATGRQILEAVSRPVRQGERSSRGFNVFDADDVALFRAVLEPSHVISGFTNRLVRRRLPDKTPAQISRLLQRLYSHGLIKKVAHSYKYYLTKLGSNVLATSLKLRELVLIPSLAKPTYLGLTDS
jgi:hypothetical protein